MRGEWASAGGIHAPHPHAAAGRLVLLDVLPPSLWLHPVGLRWRQCRRAAMPAELFASMQDYWTPRAFTGRDNRTLGGVRCILGTHPA